MKALIIDDERLARKELRTLLQEHPSIEILGECANADEAEKMISETRPDLVFLDIQMPGRTGFDLLSVLDHVPHVIFVTAYDEHAIKAFEVSALDYLLKPVEAQRLAEAIAKLPEPQSDDRVSKEVLSSEDRIFLKDGDKCWFVTLKDVRLFQSEGNYVRVKFNDDKPLVLRSLNNLEKRLDPDIFFRVSRKHIVNMAWIDSIQPWFSGGLLVKLKNGEEVEVSRRQSARFKELMSL
jgi:two-component system LytT family response regulator